MNKACGCSNDKIDFFSKFVQKMKLGPQTLICAKVLKIEFERKTM
jgi:hypothetical protein